MTNLRRAFWVMLLCMMALAARGGGSATAAEDIRIGFTPPVTGASAAEGSFQIKAIKLALIGFVFAESCGLEARTERRRT